MEEKIVTKLQEIIKFHEKILQDPEFRTDDAIVRVCIGNIEQTCKQLLENK